ncbi:MAG: AAA family ATPase [Sphingomonas bacterium]|nr:AAA family ATPase [Sphingomonas bacterium]
MLIERANAGAAPPARVERTGERRQMTIMFYDMVDSTAIATRCDPEDFNEVVDHFHDTVEAAVRSFGGFVGSRVGDGAVVYFGYPDAQEDAAERAVLSGLRAVERTRDLAFPDGQAVAIRIGIATGEGVINHREEGESGNEVVGNVANLASRLQSCAPRGAVVISDGTRRVLGGLFDLDDIGSFEVKGIAEPVQAWRIAERLPHDRYVSVPHRAETPLVGREDFLDTMRATFAKCVAGEGRTVLLIGEPGVGKSRLARAFLDDAAVAAARCITLSCSAHSKETPLHPFVRHLRHGHAAGKSKSVNDREASLGEVKGSRPEDAALIIELSSAEPSGAPALAPMSAAQRLDRTIDALVRQLDLISSSDPVLLVFEDAHWADATSLAVLERAVEAEGFKRRMLLITARPEFDPAWRSLPSVGLLHLPPLDPAYAGALLEGLPGADRLPPSVRRAILSRADGVPLFLQELTRATIELAAETGNVAVNEYELPMSLQDSLLARLDRLGPAKRIAQVAAVIGQRFTRDLLVDLSERGSAEVAAALDQLIVLALIEPDQSRAEEQFVFRHVLIREAAYSALLRADRRRLNQKLLDMLATGSSAVAEKSPARLAHYAAEGGQYGVAAEYWLKAGLAALAKSAMPEAKGLLHRGLTCAAQMGDDPARDHSELQLQLALGKALIATNGYAVPETGTAFERARQLCESTGNRQELLAVLHGLWIHDLLCARLTSAQSRADLLQEEAERASDPVWIVVACRAQGVLGYVTAQFSRAFDQLERGLSLFDPALRPDYAKILVDDPRVVMRVYQSWILSYLGETERGLIIADEALAEARALAQPYNLAHALSGWILVRLFNRMHDNLEPLIDELAKLTREHEISFYAAVCEIMRGRARIGIGEVEEGCRILVQALDVYRATGSLLYLPTFMMWLAEGLMRVGQFDKAIEVVGDAERLMDDTGMANDVAGIALLRGELQQRLGKVEEAKRTIDQAIEVAERQGAGLHLIRCRAAKRAVDKDESIFAAIE